MNLDETLFRFISGFTRRSALLDLIGIALAEYLIYLIAAVFFLFAILRKNWKQQFLSLAEGALSVILARGIAVETLKIAFARLRPYETLQLTPLLTDASGFSFPSGHAAAAFALAASLFFVNRRAGAWFFGAATLVALGRVFVGVHWPSDIVFGAALGALSAYLVRRLLERENRFNIL